VGRGSVGAGMLGYEYQQDPSKNPSEIPASQQNPSKIPASTDFFKNWRSNSIFFSNFSCKHPNIMFLGGFLLFQVFNIEKIGLKKIRKIQIFDNFIKKWPKNAFFWSDLEQIKNENKSSILFQSGSKA
jgi:hypothetical protein